MEQRKEIVYIKNNIERKVLLNNFDELKQQTLISARYLNIENKIDLLHLKNLDIYQIEDIFCKKDGICILENCNIMDSNIIKTINFHDGNFHIINLSIIEEYTNLVLINTEDVIIKSKNISNKYSIYSGIWNDKCQKIELDTIDSFKEINLKCENLLLNGIFNLEFLQLECQNQLTIGKDNIPTIINLVRFSGIIKVNILNLNNCIIINDNDLFPLNITCKILNGENFLIKSKSIVIINNQVISKNKDETDYYIITIHDLINYDLNLKKDIFIKNNFEINKLISKSNSFQEEYNLKKLRKK